MTDKYATNLSIAKKMREKELGEKITFETIGKYVGSTTANVSRMFRGPNTRMTPKMEKTAEYLGVSAEWIENFEADENQLGSSSTSKGALPEDKRPVINIAGFYAARVGNLDLQSAIMNNVIQYFDVLPRLKNYLHIFLTRLPNDDLSPRYNKDEAVIIAPMQPVSVGDYVFVSLKNSNDHYTAGLLVDNSEATIVLEMFGTSIGQKQTIQRDKLIDIHKILNLDHIINF